MCYSTSATCDVDTHSTNHLLTSPSAYGVGCQVVLSKMSDPNFFGSDKMPNWSDNV